MHKFYGSKLGGSSTVFFDTIGLLKENKHQVSVFSMQHQGNLPSRFSRYFAKNFDFNNKNSFFQKLTGGLKSLYNRDAQRRIGKLINAEQPQVAHLHNIYHYLTPSIIHELKKKQIPVVLTLHAYKEICPNYKLLNKGGICQKCQGGKYYNCFLNKCLKDSRAISLLATAEAYLHQWLKSYQKVDLMIAPSKFIKNKYIEFGFPADKIRVLPNFISQQKLAEMKTAKASLDYGKFFLYFGRLSQEKGVANLIKAVNSLKAKQQVGDYKLLIVGEGEERANLEQLVKKCNLQKEVLFLGARSGSELWGILKSANFVVVPSIWYENAPLAVTEAQFLQKPVLVSNLGGLPELVINNETGLVFDAKKFPSLEENLRKMINFSTAELEIMGKKAEKFARKLNDSDRHYQELCQIYKSLIK